MSERVPDLSVVVPVFNEERHIEATLASVGAQRFDGEAEFVFADGRSTDATREILERHAARDPRIRIVDNPKRQTAAALNVALRASRAPLVARMDAHTIYPPDYLALGVARLTRGDADWITGPALPHGVDPGSRRVAAALMTRLGTGGAGFRHASESERESITGFCGVMRRDFLEALGGWDEDWPVNQDSELGARVLAAGGRILVVPEMAARYIPRSTLRALARQYARYGFYRCKTSVRHPHSMRVAHLVPPGITCVVAAAIAGPRAIRRPARAATVVYSGALLAGAVEAAHRDGPRDAAALPPILLTMHLSWGSGFLAGCASHGPPLAGAVSAVRRVLSR